MKINGFLIKAFKKRTNIKDLFTVFLSLSIAALKEWIKIYPIKHNSHRHLFLMVYYITGSMRAPQYPKYN